MIIESARSNALSLMIFFVSLITVGYALRLRPTVRQTIGRVNQDVDIIHRVSIRVRRDKQLSNQFGVHPDKQLSRQLIAPAIACDSFSELEDYRRFHDEGRRALERGEKRPVLVWTCGDNDGCGGNGDQVKGILSSLKIAMDTKRIFLLGAWSRKNVNISSFFRASRINAFSDIRYSCTRKERLNYIDTSFKVASAAINKSSVQCLTLNYNMGFWKRDEIHSNASSGHRLGCLWNFMFQMSDAGLHLAESDQQSQHQQDMRSRNYLSMHLRFGDKHMGAGKDGRMNETEDVLKHALSCALTASLNSDGQLAVDYIELLTDSMKMKQVATNPEWLRKEFSEHFDHVMIDSTRDPAGNLTAPTHTEPSRGATKEGIYSAWRDQMIIAHSSRSVYSSGGFAVMASEIGLVPEVWNFQSKTGECIKML